FKCIPSAYGCYCHCLLYNKPNFAAIESLLKIHCRSYKFQVVFLPKFHCELNPIK
ncbi:hypothetical protein HETIRDRAFT_309807, partial [Heterobasidion irregulare TC 32-1]